MIRTVLKTLNDRKNPAPKIDPRTVVTRQMLDQSNAPLILIEVPERDIVATMLAFPGETLGDVWMGADGSTVTTMNGILVSSRGMSVSLVDNGAMILAEQRMDPDSKLLLARDNSQINVDPVVYFRITEPAKLVYDVQDFEESF
ncbi:MAG: hypothetical protein EBT20_17115, partial [Alphaproteobacteria bacterium]|nr:hypothetical protein [Alphaproteobacteria bacterium]